jgi:hypothetical protein
MSKNQIKIMVILDLAKLFLEYLLRLVIVILDLQKSYEYFIEENL